MDFFSMLGLAVLGIFATVMLTGILAGIIAFGWIDGGLRAKVQEAVISDLSNGFIQHRLELLKDELRIREAEEEKPINRRPWWSQKTLDMLSRVPPESIRLDRAIGLERKFLYRLPARQLCAQIVNAISEETYVADAAEEIPRRVRLATMMLVVAGLTSNPLGDRILVDSPRPFAFFLLRMPLGTAKLRAIAFVDSIQIGLTDAVTAAGRRIAASVIAIECVGILLPSVGMLNIFAQTGSMLLRGVGGIMAAIVCLVVGLTLFAASLVVSTLTFRWIDGFASAR